MNGPKRRKAAEVVGEISQRVRRETQDKLRAQVAEDDEADLDLLMRNVQALEVSNTEKWSTCCRQIVEGKSSGFGRNKKRPTQRSISLEKVTRARFRNLSGRRR